jgi:hypothetical protein
VKAILVLLAAAVVAPCQPVGAGLKLGLPLSDAVDLVSDSFRTERPGYTIGPFLEVRLPANFAIEFDALYEKFRLDQIGRPTARVSSWQFPLLLKYRIGHGRVRPFILGGPVAYYIGDIPDEFTRFGNSFFNGGGVVGGGVEVKFGPLRIGPEIRFTRWVIDKSVSTPLASLKLNQSQTHFFLSASF